MLVVLDCNHFHVNGFFIFQELELCNHFHVNVLVFFIFQEFELWGYAETPECLLGSDGCLYFRETCVGTSSKQSYTIKNVSRIPLR